MRILDIVSGEVVAHSRKCEKEIGMDRIRIRNFPHSPARLLRQLERQVWIVKKWYRTNTVELIENTGMKKILKL